MLLLTTHPVKNVNSQTGPYTVQTNRRVWEDIWHPMTCWLKGDGVSFSSEYRALFPWPLHVSRHGYVWETSTVCSRITCFSTKHIIIWVHTCAKCYSQTHNSPEIVLNYRHFTTLNKWHFGDVEEAAWQTSQLSKWRQEMIVSRWLWSSTCSCIQHDYVFN